MTPRSPKHRLTAWIARDYDGRDAEPSRLPPIANPVRRGARLCARAETPAPPSAAPTTTTLPIARTPDHRDTHPGGRHLGTAARLGAPSSGRDHASNHLGQPGAGARLCAPTGGVTVRSGVPIPGVTIRSGVRVQGGTTIRSGAPILGFPVLVFATFTAFFLMLLAAGPAAAQSPVTLGANVDRTTVTVGDKIRVTLTLTMPADGRIDLPALEQQFGDLEILFVALPVQQPTGNQMQVQLGYDVAAYTVGATSLPPITAEVQLADGTIAGATSGEIAINVVSVIPAGETPTDVRDLKPPIALPEPAGSNLRQIAAAIVAGLLVFGAVFLIVRRMRRPAAPAPVPIPIASTPEARARAELERIAALNLVEQGDYKQLHTLLAACIRRYLTERYRFPARAMTTSELRRLMDSYGVDRWQGRLTVGLLSESDAIIFAGYEPARTRVEANVEMAYQIVDAGDRETEPVPQAVGS